MIEKMAVDLIGQMAEEKLIDETQEEHYIYALVSLAERVITVGTIILISLAAKMLIPTLFFLVFFLSLRKRTGGYHLNSFGQCYVGTVAVYIIILGITPILVNYPKLLLGMLFPSICVIKLIGTVNHPNLHMNDEELSESNNAAGIVVVLEGFVIYFFALIRADMVYIYYMSTAIILCAVLLCAAKILKQEVKKNEKN